MLPPSGDSGAERWVAKGRTAAAHALIRLLSSLAAIDEVHLLIGEPDAWDDFRDVDLQSISDSDPDFKFADTLHGSAQEQDPEVLVPSSPYSEAAYLSIESGRSPQTSCRE